MSDITRLADISYNRFVIVNSSGTNIIFGQYNSSRQLNIYTYPLNFNAVDTLFIGLAASDSNQIYLAVNSSEVSIIFYSCVSCIFAGSVPTSTTIFS